LYGNTFESQNNLFVGKLLSLVGNNFAVEPTDGSTPTGVMVAMRAAATANVAENFSKSSILHFLTQEDGFSEAANQVFTQKHSLPLEFNRT